MTDIDPPDEGSPVPVSPNFPAVLRSTLRDLLANFAPQGEQAESLMWIWRRRPNGNAWDGHSEIRPDPIAALRLFPIASYVAAVAPLFAVEYPQYQETVWFGLGGGGGTYAAGDLVAGAIIMLWERFGTLRPNDEQLDLVIDDVVSFLSATEVEYTVECSLPRFSVVGDIKEINLATNVSIRRLPDESVERLYVPQTAFHQNPEWAVVTRIRRKRNFGTTARQPKDGSELAGEVMERVLLALRTFKSGRALLDWMSFTASPLLPFGGGFRTGRRPEGYGHYQLSLEEVPALVDHYNLVRGQLHPSLHLACSRLSDAEERRDPRDKLLDAVMGLEALLLHEVSSDTRGELSYRLRLRYSLLMEDADAREAAYETARDVYKVRCEIAHGGDTKRSLNLRGRATSLHELAVTACDMLRCAIKAFLPQGGKPDYLGDRYWERRIWHAGAQTPTDDAKRSASRLDSGDPSTGVEEMTQETSRVLQ